MKEKNATCKDTFMFNLPCHPGFLNDVPVTLINKTDLKDPAKREDYWIHTLGIKAPPDLMLKMVFRRNSSYVASLAYFYQRTVFEQWFSTQYLSFNHFYCYCCCLLVFLLLFLVVLFCWCFYCYYYYHFYYYYYYYY